jgi:hypothetical protein
MNSTTVIVMGLCSSLLVLGDLSAGSPPQVSNLTATAILGWYAWYTASRVIPGLVQDFREELDAWRKDFRDEREATRIEMLAERELRHRDSEAVVATLQELSSKAFLLTRQSTEDSTEPNHARR